MIIRYKKSYNCICTGYIATLWTACRISQLKEREDGDNDMLEQVSTFFLSAERTEIQRSLYTYHLNTRVTEVHAMVVLAEKMVASSRLGDGRLLDAYRHSLAFLDGTADTVIKGHQQGC
jgi:hypothetical protein